MTCFQHPNSNRWLFVQVQREHSEQSVNWFQVSDIMSTASLFPMEAKTNVIKKGSPMGVENWRINWNIAIELVLMPKMLCENLDLMQDVRNRDNSSTGTVWGTKQRHTGNRSKWSTPMVFSRMQPITKNAPLKNVNIPPPPPKYLRSFTFAIGMKYRTSKLF